MSSETSFHMGKPMNAQPSDSRLMDGYSLTYEQHHQIAQIGNATRAQLEAVYTPKQQRQIQQGLKADVDPEVI